MTKVRYAVSQLKPEEQNEWLDFKSFDVTKYGIKPIVLAEDSAGNRFNLFLERCEFDSRLEILDIVDMLVKAGWPKDHASEAAVDFCIDNNINYTIYGSED